MVSETVNHLCTEAILLETAGICQSSVGFIVVIVGLSLGVIQGSLGS